MLPARPVDGRHHRLTKVSSLLKNPAACMESLAEAYTPGRLNDGTEVLFDLSPDPNDSYGFGWELGTYHGERYVGNGGDWPGFHAYFARFVDRQLTVVVLFNRRDIDFVSVAFGIADLHLPTLDALTSP